MLELPEQTPDMDAELLEQCSLYVDICGVIPHPYEIMALPKGYLDNLALYRMGVKYYEDLPKRPQVMRKKSSG